jgi:hypothetical protein
MLLAAYLVLNGVLIQAGLLSLASGSYLLGEYSVMGPILYFAVAIALALIGVGLLRRWRLARRLAIVAAAFLVATAVVPISAAVIYFRIPGIAIQGLKIITAMVAIQVLLRREVVDWFSN